MILRPLTIAAALLLLSGCVSLPKPLQGEYAPLAPHAAVSGHSAGAQVRWGGRIVETLPRENRTCFEIVSARLAGDGRPLRNSDGTEGRFIACRPGFYDPEVFAKDREVTFTGRIDGEESRRIGEFHYRFPRLAADVVYLWPERPQVEVFAYPVAPSPWWGGWGWGPGWWW